MTSFNVIVGTYEEFLLGFTFQDSKTENLPGKISKIFASHSHVASIRCVAGCGEIVASGGADDKIFINCLKSRQEIAILTAQSSTVNTVEFSPDGSHLFAGCADGSMLAYACDTWEVVKVWKDAHKGSSVNQIRIHPSGKLALSLGGDLTLRTWNLIKGRQAYATNLKSKQELGRIVECVEWAPNGEFFALSGSKIVQIWSSQDASVKTTINCTSRPTCLTWITSNILAIGMESGQILLNDASGNLPEKLIEAHSKRVKGISCRNSQFVTSVGSSGDVTVWSVSVDSRELKKITSTNIGCRPTCVFNTINNEFPSVKSESVQQSPQISKEEKHTEEIVTIEEEPASPDAPQLEQKTPQTPIGQSDRKKKRKMENVLVETPVSVKKLKKREKKSSLNPFSSFKVTDVTPEDLNLSVGGIESKKSRRGGGRMPAELTFHWLEERKVANVGNRHAPLKTPGAYRSCGVWTTLCAILNREVNWKRNGRSC
ncbi:p21-activated protein kinase-interacting protein 1-like [Sergentomyia squamirostris]